MLCFMLPHEYLTHIIILRERERERERERYLTSLSVTECSLAFLHTLQGEEDARGCWASLGMEPWWGNNPVPSSLLSLFPCSLLTLLAEEDEQLLSCANHWVTVQICLCAHVTRAWNFSNFEDRLALGISDDECASYAGAYTHKCTHMQTQTFINRESLLSLRSSQFNG